MKTFLVRIATPDCDFYSGAAEYLSVDTPDGRVGFLRGALPRIAVLSRGRIELTDGEGKKIFYCGDGMLRVGADSVTVLTSDCSDSLERLGHGDDDFVRRDVGEDRDYRRAKARIVSSVRKMRDKTLDQDKV